MLFSQGLACIQTRQLGFSRGAGRSGLVFPHIPAAIRGGLAGFPSEEDERKPLS